MYELIQVSDNCYYIQNPAKIGIVKLNDIEVCLIDSGNDKNAGKKILNILNEKGWKLKAIYNTHSNADHIGGNRYLQQQTGCKIYANGIECDFSKHPFLEPTFIYGGFPTKELRNKFLLAEESDVEYITSEKLPECLEIIPLPGHFFDMVGFRISEDVVFLADCLSSKEILDKYKITFIYDVAQYLDTLEYVKSLKGKVFIPSHAPVTEDISELAQYNIDKVMEVGEKILKICSTPICFEEILQKLFSEYNLKMNFQQYALIGSTVRSYLSWLKYTDKLATEFVDNMLLWKTIK